MLKTERCLWKKPAYLDCKLITQNTPPNNMGSENSRDILRASRCYLGKYLEYSKKYQCSCREKMARPVEAKTRE